MGIDMAMCCGLCMFGSCEQCACLARDTCVLVARSPQSLPWIQPSPFPPPSSAASSFPTADGGVERPADCELGHHEQCWTVLESVGKFVGQCWVTTDASRAFPSAATHVSWSQGTDQGLLSSLAAQSGSSNCLSFCGSPSVCLSFCGCADHHRVSSRVGFSQLSSNNKNYL